MASPELAITKATLSASLFRADPTSLSRPAVEAFFPLLTNTLVQCSRPNVQKCKVWIVDNIVPSSTRSGALGKFLVALSKSLAEEDNKKRPSIKRRRLHLLYVVNDVLFHEIVRRGNRKFAETWNGVLPALVGSAAAFKNCPKHLKKLDNLIALWQEKKYFSTEVVSQLRDALANGAADNSTVDIQSSETSLKLARDAPYTLPSLHGDASSPWYDLPAATWLPHMIPNSTKPMIPDRIRPVQLAPGPADQRLADAVKSLIEDVDRIFSKEKKWDNDPYIDVSGLGERVTLDEITGDIIGGTTYYGWSRQFCEQMKERKKRGTKKPARGRSSRSRSTSRSRSYSRGRSRSYSPPSFKRPRLSSRSRSRHRSRSRSPSRSRRGNGSYSRSRSRNRSSDRNYSSGNGNAPHHRRSDSRSRSPVAPSSRYGNTNRPPPPHQPHMQPTPFPPVPPPGMGDFPIPPPPPAGYHGHWPPPPPPPIPPPMAGAPQQGWMPNPAMMMPQMMGGWTGGPPPPPPPQHNHYGRGNGGFRGRGRGGYDRGGYRGR